MSNVLGEAIQISLHARCVISIRVKLATTPKICFGGSDTNKFARSLCYKYKSETRNYTKDTHKISLRCDRFGVSTAVWFRCSLN
jgi:hypothetical protein